MDMESTYNTIIIADARTGSNLLGFSLGSNPYMKYGDEILSSAIPCIPKEGKNYAKSIGHPIDKLPVLDCHRHYIATPEYIEHMFESYNIFKILYYHLEGNQSLTDYIINSDVNIIHLTRKSYIDKYISYQIALRDDFLYKRRAPDKKPIAIDIDDFIKYMSKAISAESEWNKLLSGREKVLDVEYSDMDENWDDVMNRCQEFIGVPYHKITRATFKAIKGKNIDLVINKEELLEVVYNNNLEEYL